MELRLDCLGYLMRKSRSPGLDYSGLCGLQRQRHHEAQLLHLALQVGHALLFRRLCCSHVGNGKERVPVSQRKAIGQRAPCLNECHAGLEGTGQLWPSNGKPEIDRNQNRE